MSKLLESCQILKDMFESRSSYSQSGERIPIHSNIQLSYAEALYELVLRTDPAVVLEVGVAFGVASLAILSALRLGKNHGKLISIDPAQSSYWKGCGRAAI